MNDNPFTSPLVDSLWPGAKALALKMARRGATRGMIVQKLRKEDMDEQMANQLADQAMRNVAYRERLVGVGYIFVGTGVLASAWLSTWFFFAKVPIVLGMFGLIAVGIGISKAAHRASLPIETPDSKGRIR